MDVPVAVNVIDQDASQLTVAAGGTASNPMYTSNADLSAKLDQIDSELGMMEAEHAHPLS